MPWFRYKRRGLHDLPVEKFRLGCQGKWSTAIEFLIDSGAAVSFIPRKYVRWVPGLDERAVQATGLVDANGRAMTGVPVDFKIELVRGPGELAVEERIWVSNSGTWPLLGQSWFELMGVNFQNFPGTRRFAIYPPPSHALF